MKKISDKEFIKRVEAFEISINKRAAKLEELTTTIKFSAFHTRDKRYDHNKGGFIQILMTKTDPRFR